MKKLLTLAIMALALLSCHNKLWNSIDDLESKYQDLDGRVTKLEELCKEMNTNITALKTIVNVIQQNDYITNVTLITKNGKEIGYVITFGKHDPITIYHGNNGTNGIDGQGGDSSAPIIGIRQDTDGIYYWTLNGEWMLNDEGQRLRVSGLNGNDGTSGQDGKNGKDGKDGTDGVTPQLKIEDDYWYVSYDNGTTWTQLGKATSEGGEKGEKGDKGDQGEKGDKGDKGDTGDSMFQSVTQDDSYVYFTLADGTLIKINKNTNEDYESADDQKIEIVDGAIQAAFSVSTTKKVYFSHGNLWYNAMAGTHLCADWAYRKGVWKFAENQYDTIGKSQIEKSSTYDGWISAFAWGTSGWDSGAKIYQPDSVTGDNPQDYWPGNKSTNNLTGNYAYADWGVFNAIINGGNQPQQWRTLTREEWDYLLNKRNNADILKSYCKVTGIEGLMLLPDTFTIPSGIYYMSNRYPLCQDFSIQEFKRLENRGAVFIPKDISYCFSLNNIGWKYDEAGDIWTASNQASSTAYSVVISSDMSCGFSTGRYRCDSGIVRLVKDAE